MQAQRARPGLIGLATAFTALLAIVPAADAATFNGGAADFSGIKGGLAVNKATAPAKREGKRAFEVAVIGGAPTLNASPRGSLFEDGSVELKQGGRKATLSNFKETFSGGKVTTSVAIGGRSVNLFEGKLAGKIKVPAGFTSLNGSSIDLVLTRDGAKAFNKAFKPKKSKQFKRGQKIGKKSFEAQRSLMVTGGETRLIFDEQYAGRMEACHVKHTPRHPATTIDPGPGAPKGGITITTSGGSFNAKTQTGSVAHGGGVSFDRTSPNPPYQTELLNFLLDFSTTPPTLRGFSTLTGITIDVGTVEGGTLTFTLSETGGTVTLNGALLRLSDFANVLQSGTEQSGEKCDVSPGTVMATVNAQVNVE